MHLTTAVLVAYSGLTCLFLPIIVYGLVCWYRFRYHYVIRERYPMVCYMIIISSYSCLSLNCILVKLLVSASLTSSEYITVSAVKSGLAFIVYSMTVYRALLVYLRWRVVQKQLSFYVSAVKGGKNKRPAFHNHVKRHALAISYFIAAVFALLLILYFKCVAYSGRLSGIPWVLQTFIGVIIIGIIFYYKVKEAIGCLLECYVFFSGLIIYYIIELAIIPLFGFTETARILTLSIFSFSIMSLAMFITLLNSLRIIYKDESTLNYDVYKKNHEYTISEEMARDAIAGKEVTAVKKCSKKDSEKIRSASTSDVKSNDDEKSNGSTDIDLSLNIFQFLQFQKNYDRFMEYLGFCFAIESLLFIQRVSIFHNFILQQFNSDSRVNESIDFLDNFLASNGNFHGRKHLYRAKFKYLRNVWDKYEDLMVDVIPDDDGIDTVVVIDAGDDAEKEIDIVVGNDDKMFMKYRHSLFVMCQEICEEFIYDEAPQQINIPEEVQQTLLFMLVADENIAKFSCFGDILYLFDDAMSESYFLLGSIYSIKFKSYLKAQFGQQVILERLMNSFI